MSVLAPWEPDPGCETHEWRSAAGDTVRFVTRVSAQARMMPPVSLQLVNIPDSHGSRFLAARHEARLVVLPVVLPGPHVDRDELRRWAAALDPAKGEGTLTVVDGPWPGRQLVCTYEAGLDTYVEDEPSLGLTALGFRAADPYWQDATESEQTAGLGDNAYRWFPFAGSWAAQPLLLGASDVFAVLTVDNTGDVDAWPVINVTGPGQNLTVTNQTTGKLLNLAGIIGPGSVVAIDTRPGYKTVTVDGNNAFQQLSADSSLWPLVPGANRVQVGFTAADLTSAVHFAWRRRWLAA